MAPALGIARNGTLYAYMLLFLCSPLPQLFCRILLNLLPPFSLHFPAQPNIRIAFRTEALLQELNIVTENAKEARKFEA